MRGGYVHNCERRSQFDFQKGDTVAFHKKLDKLLENIENKSFRDVIYHQKAIFYDKKEKDNLAILNYNKSIKNSSKSNIKVLTSIKYRGIIGSKSNERRIIIC